MENQVGFQKFLGISREKGDYLGSKGRLRKTRLNYQADQILEQFSCLICFQFENLILKLYFCRVPEGGVFKEGGNWGTLRIPREDWGTLGKIREPPPLGTPPP